MNRIVCVLSSSVFKVRVIVFVLCALVCVTCFLSGIDVEPPPFFSAQTWGHSILPVPALKKLFHTSIYNHGISTLCTHAHNLHTVSV